MPVYVATSITLTDARIEAFGLETRRGVNPVRVGCWPVSAYSYSLRFLSYVLSVGDAIVILTPAQSLLISDWISDQVWANADRFEREIAIKNAPRLPLFGPVEWFADGPGEDECTPVTHNDRIGNVG